MLQGAEYKGRNKCDFTVWAPGAASVELQIEDHGGNRTIDLEPAGSGYWHKQVKDAAAGSLYLYRLNGSIQRADPASRFQPEGIHGRSAVVDQGFAWKDRLWPGIAPEEMIIYELHTGTFTEQGTFDAVAERLDDLSSLGVNTIELMPVAQFPGERNWGYDGVFPYAVQNSYGGPAGLKRLVDACHRKRLAVILDVVYNHLGPEGNYLGDFGPYFTDKYKTAWGRPLNFDGPYSDQVRDFFFENALYWFREFHMDALRLDALHAIFDSSAKHFIKELAERVEDGFAEAGRRRCLIGESDLNDVRLITPRSRGGYGLDAQWCDDFHHSVHALLTGEQKGYYRDFGGVSHLAKAYREGFVYSWDYSEYRKRRHGSSSRNLPAGRFVVCIQNHDQVGNRMLGERLSALVGFEELKIAAVAFMLSPYIPLIFMGQEYAEDAPFQYFISHTDGDLIRAVRQGRTEEFKSFQWRGTCPDPQSERTFEKSKLNWRQRDRGRHKVLLDFYRSLIALRTGFGRFTGRKGLRVRSMTESGVLIWHRRFGPQQVQCLINFSRTPRRLRIYAPRGGWIKILDSAEAKWNGPGGELPAEITASRQVVLPALSAAVFRRTDAPGRRLSAGAAAVESTGPGAAV